MSKKSKKGKLEGVPHLGGPKIQMKVPDQSQIIKLRQDIRLRSKDFDASLAIDHLEGLVPLSAHQPFPYKTFVEGGLHEAYKKLLAFGKEVLERIREIFGVALELTEDNKVGIPTLQISLA